ncbi:MAG TPA: hypothetical protein DIT19_00240 [Desulfonauticus sp.]|jgi:hypothetical protein|nr:MAG: hypothetical protein XD41_1231 [Desulfonauticus sp. 38_4375]MDK2921735.1 hypothetical protein [Desulfonauticus sp.]HCO11641.1 hypothetical protein [Desulfonauticus sp.]
MKELVFFMSKQKVAPKQSIPLPPLGMFVKEALLKILNFGLTQIKKQKMFFNYYSYLTDKNNTLL